MPVMRHLNVGGTTYDTVGEASVTRTQTTGTKIATITIDGTSTDLYAPEGGGGSVTPSSTTPAMDGTAAVGTSTDYARADHVHPTDTSRAASSHTHGSITNDGAITSDTTVASGDKLVIADSSDSSKLKRSGIAFGSSTSTFLRNDGTWATPSGGGGGGGGWVDVTPDFIDEDSHYEEDYVFSFKALCDGKTVMLIGCVGIPEETLAIPSQYYAYPVLSILYCGTCTNLFGNLSTAPFVDAVDGSYCALSTGIGTESETFTIIYPLASAVS